MKISEVKIILSNQNVGPVAFASVLLNDEIYLNSLAVWKSECPQKFKVSYPSKGAKEHQVIKPINAKIHNEISQAILDRMKVIY